MLVDLGQSVGHGFVQPRLILVLSPLSNSLLACPSSLRYSGVLWCRDESVSEGAATRLRDLTCGSANSLGFSSVSRLLRTGTRLCRPGTVLALPAVLAQGLRAFLSPQPSPEPLLLGRLPHRSATLATPAGQPHLAGQRGRQDAPAAAVPALSATAPPGRSARAAGVASAGRASSACSCAPRGGVRGPAPSNHS